MSSHTELEIALSSRRDPHWNPVEGAASFSSEVTEVAICAGEISGILPDSVLRFTGPPLMRSGSVIGRGRANLEVLRINKLHPI